MDLPALQPGEKWLIQSVDVYIKSAPFAAFLTTARMIVRPAGNKIRPDHILPRESIAGVHAATNEFGEPVLSIEAMDGTGKIRKIVLTFSGHAGTSRTGERDQWIRFLSGTHETNFGAAPEKITHHSTKPKTENIVPYDNRKMSFHTGIHEHDTARPRVQEQQDTRTQEDPRGLRYQDPAGLDPNDRSHRIQEPKMAGSGPSQDPKKQRGLPIIKIRDDPDAGFSERPGDDPQCPEPRTCKTCGKTLQPRSQYCNYCGTPVPVRGTSPDSIRGRVTADPGKARLDSRHTGTIRSSTIKFLDAPDAVPVELRSARSGASPEWGRARSNKEIRKYRTGRPEFYSRAFAGYKKVAGVAVIICAIILIIAVGGLYHNLPTGFGNNASIAGPTTVSLQKNAAALVPVTTVPGNYPSGISASATGLPTLTTLAISSTTESLSNADPLNQNLNFILSCKCGVYVRVNYSGSWSGTYGMDEDIRSATNSGEKIFQIENAQGSVTASFQKADSSDQELTVEIYNNGQLVGSGSSKDPKGTVAITAEV